MSILPLITAGTNILGNALGLLSANKQADAALQAQRETNQTNIELQQAQNDFNYRMWQESNQYNSLSSQVDRAREAGLNPNVVLSHSLATSPVQQNTLPSLNSGSDILMQAGLNQMQAFQGIGMSASNLIDNIMKVNQIDDIKASAEGKKIDNSYKPAQYEVQIKEANKQIDTLDATIKSILENIEKTKAEIKKTNVESEYIDSQTTAQDIRNLNLFSIETEQLHLLRQQILNISEETRFIGYNAKTGRISATALREQSLIAGRLANANIDLLNKTGLKVDAETKKIYQDCIQSYWEGNYTKAQYEWQQFSNRVRNHNGSKYYADTEKEINDVNIAEGVSRTANNVVKTATSVVDAIKPW